MESLKRAQESIGRMWANLNATQRVILSAAAAAMALLLVWSSAGTTQAWVRVAGPEVDQNARYNIIKKLQERNQKHEIRGSEIFVPKEDADRIVLELAGEVGMSDDVIWDFLKSSDPFVDRRQKDLRYKRALEQKLSAMIRRVEIVRNANVVITPGSDSDRVGFEGNRAKASVQVELQEGRSLSTKNVVAISNLVAKAVQGLDADQVVISDNKLNSYSLPKQDGGSMQAIWFRDYEKQIEDDIQSRIKQAFRTASVVVRISARNTQIRKETHKNTNPKPIEEQENRHVEKGNAASPGKVLKGGDVPVEPADSGNRTDQESRTKYVHDQESMRVDDPAGKIEKITIGVLIPIEVGPDNKELTEANKDLPKIKEWVTAAAGLEAVEKSVSVQFIPSKRPEPIAAAAGSEVAAVWFATHWMKIVLSLLALAGLATLSLVIRGAMAKDTVEELQGLATSLTAEPAAELAVPSEGDLGRLKEGLQEMVGRNPQTVAASLKSFMSGR
jgi:flagellar M-ring protein FliF